MKTTDPYDGKFIDADKMQDIVQDILAVLEKWKLRQLEKEIALHQSLIYCAQIKANEISQSRMADAEGFIKKMKKKFLPGVDDDEYK